MGEAEAARGEEAELKMEETRKKWKREARERLGRKIRSMRKSRGRG